MKTNQSQSNLHEFTKSLADELQDDNLALTLQLWAESLMKVLVFVYVAGVMASEVVQPYLTQLGELFTYKIPQMGDDTDAVQTETMRAGGIN